MEIKQLDGAEALAGIESAGGLLYACGAPVSAQPLWLTAWGETHAQDWRPHVLMVLDDQEPVGLAALGVRRRGPLTEVVLLGHGLSDYGLLAVADRRAATALATGLVGFLTGLSGPWRLRLEQLPAGDPVALMVAAALPYAQVVEGTSTLRFTPSEDPAKRTLRHHGGRNMIKSKNQHWNRIIGSGLPHELRATRDAEEIGELLHATVALHRARDHAVGRRSDLDDPAARAFHRRVVGALAARGEIEMITLRLDGAVAAYGLSLIDAGVYRAWAARMDSRWGRYAAGRLVQLASVESALADPKITSIDLMRGESGIKTRLADEVREHEHLHAASSNAVWRAWHGIEGLRDAVPASVKKAVRRVELGR